MSVWATITAASLTAAAVSDAASGSVGPVAAVMLTVTSAASSCC